MKIEPAHGDVGREGKCKGSCCRTPFGVCARHGKCPCHEATEVKPRDALARLLAEAEGQS